MKSNQKKEKGLNIEITMSFFSVTPMAYRYTNNVKDSTDLYASNYYGLFLVLLLRCMFD